MQSHYNIKKMLNGVKIKEKEIKLYSVKFLKIARRYFWDSTHAVQAIGASHGIILEFHLLLKAELQSPLLLVQTEVLVL